MRPKVVEEKVQQWGVLLLVLVQTLSSKPGRGLL
jgi:hypothetical protein